MKLSEDSRQGVDLMGWSCEKKSLKFRVNHNYYWIKFESGLVYKRNMRGGEQTALPFHSI